MKITLNRKQIRGLIDIYHHFRDINEFNIYLEDGKVRVGIDLVSENLTKPIRVDKNGIEL
jgi:hypothetical protein